MCAASLKRFKILNLVHTYFFTALETIWEIWGGTKQFSLPLVAPFTCFQWE